MRWKIAKTGSHPAISFAVEELEKYLKRMDKEALVTVIWAETFGNMEDALWVGMDKSFGLIPAVEDTRFDDAIYIDVKRGRGFITGSNPRSVLIAVYRYLTELGCAFLRPGMDGEVIPSLDASRDTVHVEERASYRHRSVCIEGAVSYGHVCNMIDWLPKVGMNGYFIQFIIPYTFFDRWYAHEVNPTLQPESVTVAEVEGMVKNLVCEISKRGMDYHAVGHGWTCEPLGINGLGWDVKDVSVPPGAERYFAEVNGKRELWHGIPLNTNLCYSNPEVRERMTDAIAEFCSRNPEVNYLHFWLADDSNNQCECGKCVEEPSDYYVMMLNRLDEKLTGKGINTKIVFLIYLDLLWKPVKEKLHHPDRFVLMFAPITRTYTHSYKGMGTGSEAELEPYVKNRLKMPTTIRENIAYLKQWQSFIRCDSFDFDYHFMWDHFLDPGYFHMAQILHEDMQSLGDIGLNGMVSCQNQRVFFPSSLGMVVMARTLWNKEAAFSEIARDYFNEAFGADGNKVSEYLRTISGLFDPEYLRAEKPSISPENAEKLSRVPAVASEFMKVIIKNLDASHPHAIAQSWKYLIYHANYCILLAGCLAHKARGNMKEAYAAWDEVVQYLCGIEMEIHNVFDLHIFLDTYKRVLNSAK